MGLFWFWLLWLLVIGYWLLGVYGCRRFAVVLVCGCVCCFVMFAFRVLVVYWVDVGALQVRACSYFGCDRCFVLV